MRGGNFMGGDNPGTHWAVAINAFAFEKLLVARLEVAGRDIVEDGIAENMRQGILLADILATLADNHGQFGFPVDLLRDCRVYHDIAIWPVDGGWCLRENHRIFWHFRFLTAQG